MNFPAPVPISGIGAVYFCRRKQTAAMILEYNHFLKCQQESKFLLFLQPFSENSDGYCGTVEKNRQILETGTATGSPIIGAPCLVFQCLVAFGDAFST